MWSLSLLKWFTGSLTLCRNFLLVCRFCFVCLLRRAFFTFSLVVSLTLIIFLSSGIHFIPTPCHSHSYTNSTRSLVVSAHVRLRSLLQKNVAPREHVKYDQTVNNTPTDICVCDVTHFKQPHYSYIAATFQLDIPQWLINPNHCR